MCVLLWSTFVFQCHVYFSSIFMQVVMKNYVKNFVQKTKTLIINLNASATTEIVWKLIRFAAFFAGLHRSELTAGEIAEEMDKERKYLQLTTTEYLLKINEVRSKKGADLIEQLLEYYKAQHK